MPTILRFRGLRVVIYPNDHTPAHVHVIGGNSSARLQLNCPHGPVVLWENFGFSPPQLRWIMWELTANLALLCEAWRRIHGI
jgi:hypothetical protein